VERDGAETVITCDSCGHRNDDGLSFCASCGRFLEWTAAEPATRTEPADPAVPAQRPKEPQQEEDAGTETDVVVADAVAFVERGRQLAEGCNRPDLARQLDGARSRLTERTIPVAVVGEFKRGKSTLVNALLQRAVCPVDADVVTAVPTLVRYGEQLRVTAYVEADDGGEPRPEEMPVEILGELVSEAGNPGNRRRLRSVEVYLPHRMLRSGLCLLDTPGVGGLDSAHGLITMSALEAAEGMVFVTDSSQELTGPELDFLRQALDRCPTAACIVTKVDLYPEWRRIVALDEGHLRRAGLDLPVVPVSSFLRLRARQDPSFNEESGFRGLVDFLAGTVVRRGAALAASTAASDVRFVAGQIGRQVEAERAVLQRPQQAERLVAGLATATERAARLAAPTASWQQTLTDRVQDLVADIEHDLQERLRGVLRDAEAVLDQGDPKDTWDDFQVWLRRQVVAGAVANYDALAVRAGELAGDVAAQFDLESGTPVEVRTAAPSEALSTIEMGSSSTFDLPGGRLAFMLLGARSASFLPMMLFGVAGGILGVAVVAPLSVALGAGIGTKIIRDERQRQMTYRRQQAKTAVRKYLDEVAFTIGKDSRDALRRTQRQLRDEFQTRAAAIHRSTAMALSAAQEARRLPEEDRAARAAELAAESGELRRLRDGAARLTTAGSE
jgi:hypothetical protein